MTDRSGSEVGREVDYVEIDLYSPFDADEPVERLALDIGEPFDAELISDKWRIEVVGVRYADTETEQ